METEIMQNKISFSRRKSSLIDESDIDIGHFISETDNSVLDSIKAVVLWSHKLEETMEKWEKWEKVAQKEEKNS